MHGRVVGIRVWHRGVHFRVNVSFAVKIVFDVHFPGGISLLQAVDDVLGEGFITPHGDKGIAEEIVLSSGVISFDDPGCGKDYLTYLSCAMGSRICLSCSS